MTSYKIEEHVKTVSESPRDQWLLLHGGGGLTSGSRKTGFIHNGSLVRTKFPLAASQASLISSTLTTEILVSELLFSCSFTVFKWLHEMCNLIKAILAKILLVHQYSIYNCGLCSNWRSSSPCLQKKFLFVECFRSTNDSFKLKLFTMI